MKEYIDNRGTIESKIDDQGLATLTFYHPLHNSFPSNQLEKLADTILRVGENEATKLILLKSKGDRTFCSGASFDELLTLKTREDGRNFFSGFAHVLNAIRLTKKIVVVQVQGKAIGGGMGLVAACDYSFATQHAQVRLSELGVNLGPFVVAPAIERKIGLAALTELTLNPDLYKDANWAKDKGLYQEVYMDIKDMEAAVNQFCQRLCSYHTEALIALKKVFWENTEHWATLLYERADLSGRLVLTEETRVKLQAFKAKK